MKRLLSLLILICSSLSVFSYNAAEINRFKAVFNEYPQHVPTDFTVDAPIAGNGDIGLTMAASSGKLTFYIGKNDFWKAIPSYPDGHIGLPGMLEISSPVFKDVEYYAEQLPGTAEIKAKYTSKGNVLNLCSWVSALDNKVVIELESTAQTVLKLNLMASDGDQATTSGGTENGCRWVSRSYEGIELLEWPSHVAIAMNSAEDEIVLKPGEKRTVVLAVYTNHDTEQWKETAIKEALESTDDSIAETRKAHLGWWEEFWALSGISMEDPLIEQYYYQSQYIFACSSRAGKYAPGLWGPFITTDKMAWAGDYHLNYNYQGPYWASYSSNHISLTENYDQPILDYMDKGRKHAWNLFKCRGVLYPVGLGPNGLCSSAWPASQEKMKAWYNNCPNTIEDGVMLWQQKTNASFAAANMMMRFYSTYDEDYARKIYPFIVACAEFWEDYLTWQDGRYVVIGDVFYETAPWTDYEGDFNCAVSLGMARMTFLAADTLSRFLKVDRKKRSGWNHILKHLSEFPARVNEEGRLSLDYCERDGVKPSGTNRILMHGTLLPTGLTGPCTTPEYTKAMREDLTEWKSAEGRDWGNSMGNGVETVYPGAARVGYPAAEILKHLKERIVMGSYPNCYIYAGGGGIETLSAVPSTINEMMMQSYEGIIRIFPDWDRSQNGSFFNLRAYGAFLVSSSIKDGEIQKVSLLSEKGRKCVVENPWPGKAVQIVVDGKVRKRQKGQTISFKTKEGQTYELLAECCQTPSDWTIGPFTRPVSDAVISPDTTKVFFCPMRGENVRWQESDTFNPAAVVKDGKICVLFRSEDNSATGIGTRTSRVGYAETTDGITMKIAPEPVLFPKDDAAKDLDWSGGCEDPRVARTEDGLYVMMYTSWNRSVARLCVATSRDLKNWEKHGCVFADAYDGRYMEDWSKSGSIVTTVNKNDEIVIEKFDGKYLMYWGEEFVNLATSTDLVHWTPVLGEDGELLQIIKPREGMFDSSLTECGPPAVHTKDGIVLIYNGKSAQTGAYCAGQVLFDAKDPTKVLARTDEPFFVPELPFEKSGQYVDGTVFVEGLVRYNHKWYLYYGCADSFVGVAIAE